MKRQRLHFKLLFLVMAGLFALLAAYGAYSVLTYGNRWFASNRNPRVRAQKESVIAGDILDRQGTVLATTAADGTRTYQAREAARRAVVHMVGDPQGQVSTGVETFQTSYLYGFRASFTELVRALTSGEPRRGDNVTLTADSRLCTAIVSSFDGHSASYGKRGAAVVLNYRTGEVLAEVSLPNFDPAHISETLKDDAGRPFWNRVTQSIYPPGSTFKTVTEAAALRSLEDIGAFSYDCAETPLTVGAHEISDYGGGSHGTLDLSTAFARSCNKAFAELALRLGQRRLLQTAEEAGFNDNFLFRDLVVENSRFPLTAADDWELAASGFGQSSVAASPLHMCMIAGAVANGGVMMEPRLLRQVTSPAGRVRLAFTSQVYRRAFTPEVAERLRGDMRLVVTGGTGRAAAVNGVTVCGKTGTADSTEDGKPISYGWFIGFAQDDDLPFACAVLVEDIGEKTSGGAAAAPIAADIFLWLRQHQREIVDAPAQP